MQEIEAGGGYRKAVADGMLRNALETSMAAREKAVASRRRVLTGTNQFANATEQALDRIDVARAMTAYGVEHRVMRSFGFALSVHAAATGRLPRVLLAEIGDVKMRVARSTFAANFFACAGFEDRDAEIFQCRRDCRKRCGSDRTLQFRSGVSQR